LHAEKEGGAAEKRRKGKEIVRTTGFGTAPRTHAGFCKVCVRAGEEPREYLMKRMTREQEESVGLHGHNCLQRLEMEYERQLPQE